jgi:hypothetical protein
VVTARPLAITNALLAGEKITDPSPPRLKRAGTVRRDRLLLWRYGSASAERVPGKYIAPPPAYPGGDQAIFAGEVAKATVTEEHPVIYFRRRLAQVQ